MPTGLAPIHHHDHGPDQGQGIPIHLPDQGHVPDLTQAQDPEVEGKYSDPLILIAFSRKHLFEYYIFSIT